jgi:hypothetical protein
MSLVLLALACSAPARPPVASARPSVGVEAVAPVKVDPCWTTEGSSDHEVPTTVHDLDGNGQDEDWTEEVCDRSYPCESNPWEAREGERVVAAGTMQMGFSSMIETMAMPPVLVGNPKARKTVERALGMTVCDSPDPGFAHLIGRGGPGVHWIAGTEVEPTGFYWIADEEGPTPRWVLYKGQTQTSTAGVTPSVIASIDGLSLVRLAHALVVVDAPKSRHAWVLVSSSNQKLRWATVGACASLRGHHALVARLPSPEDENMPEGTGWDVDLDTGVVTAAKDVPACEPSALQGRP